MSDPGSSMSAQFTMHTENTRPTHHGHVAGNLGLLPRELLVAPRNLCLRLMHLRTISGAHARGGRKQTVTC
jgi:hypothetical protein